MPLYQDTARTFTYGPWLAKFAVSMSWRVLTLFRLKGDTLAPPLQAAADAALATWRDFLLDRVPHPDRFEQHAILLDAIIDSSIPDLPTNINRYILRVFELDVARNEASAFVYVKLCRLFVIGFIEMPRRSQWRDTRLQMRGGTLEIGGEVSLLGPIWPWVMDRVRNVTKRYADISPMQKAKIAETYRKDLDRAAESGTLQAMDYDVLLFGDDAFGHHES